MTSFSIEHKFFTHHLLKILYISVLLHQFLHHLAFYVIRNFRFLLKFLIIFTYFVYSKNLIIIVATTIVIVQCLLLTLLSMVVAVKIIVGMTSKLRLRVLNRIKVILVIMMSLVNSSSSLIVDWLLSKSWGKIVLIYSFYATELQLMTWLRILWRVRLFFHSLGRKITRLRKVVILTLIIIIGNIRIAIRLKLVIIVLGEL